MYSVALPTVAIANSVAMDIAGAAHQEVAKNGSCADRLCASQWYAVAMRAMMCMWYRYMV